MKKKVVLLTLVLVLLLFPVVGIEFNPPVTAEVPEPTLYVDPPSITRQVGQSFTVDIRIRDLEEAWHLYGWEAKVGYDTNLLDASACEEGPFLPGFAGPGDTYFSFVIEDTQGYVHMVGQFLGSPSPYGSGVLATITFKCTGAGECVLDLYDTVLADDSSNQIPHYVEDGYVIQTPSVDTDGDGLSDAEEVAGWDIIIYDCSGVPTGSYHVTSDPNDADTDDDGLNDYQEKQGWDIIFYTCEGDLDPGRPPIHVTSDPNVPDTDGDGLRDDFEMQGWEVTYRRTDTDDVTLWVRSHPHNDNCDGDGLDDYQEWFYGANPNRRDSDCDEGYDTNDGFEVSNGLNPLDFDTDDDGVKDGIEIDLWLVAGYSLGEAVAKTKDPLADPAPPGDVNGDGNVDLFDAVAAALVFGRCEPYYPGEDRADLNQDGIIDIFDMVIIGIHYGETAW